MMDSLSEPLWHATSWVMFASIKSIGVIAAIFLFRRVLKTWLSAQARHGLWLAAIASLAIPVGFQVETDVFANLALPQWTPSHKQAVISADDSLPQLTSPQAQKTVDAPTVPAERSTTIVVAAADQAISIEVWIDLMWMLIALLLFVITLRNQVRCARLISAAHAIEPSTLRLFEQCKKRIQLQRTVRLLQSSTVESPAVFGWWSPTLLVPSGLAHELNAQELRYVFLHELAHVQRHDVLINWIATLVQIVHWFNPFVWIALRTMRTDMEQACDAKVMNLLNEQERIGYGNTLIRLTELLPGPMRFAPAVAIVENHSQLKARINMITEFDPKRIGYSALAAGLLAAVSTVAFTQPKASAAVASIVEPTIASTISRAPTVAQAAPRVQLAQAPKPTKESSAVEAAKSQAADFTPVDKRKQVVEPAGAAANLNSDKDGIPLSKLIENVARQTKKSFVVDPRLKNIRVNLIGQKPDQISYAILLSILRINSATAVETNGFVNVIPVTDARSMPLPIADAKSDFPEDQWVSRTYSLQGLCALTMLQILRPLVPQYAHLAADVTSNSLLLADTFGNSKRLGKIIDDMESRTTGKCGQKGVPTKE